MDKKTVLVVDDEPCIRRVIEVKLKNAGYEVMTASDGREALERALATPPSLIVIDEMMPGLDGIRTCRQLRTRDSTRQIPVIMLTPAGDQFVEEDARDAGVTMFKTKPFSPRELLGIINDFFK